MKSNWQKLRKFISFVSLLKRKSQKLLPNAIKSIFRALWYEFIPIWKQKFPYDPYHSWFASALKMLQKTLSGQILICESLFNCKIMTCSKIFITRIRNEKMLIRKVNEMRFRYFWHKIKRKTFVHITRHTWS